ncbi:centrosomin isoform X2 [Aricia agestis]|uniref:centrosomin isoform X2 n=1 Tax=Aricia agestis TaxID=91739 RepID=UPI001C20A6E8|nr:centrosomin isoform X2 [Aricia agestis]
MSADPAEITTVTSPRKLQEVTLPNAEGHDVTNASVVSLKQYEEQLNGLRKENFHLKLRIYFLEEKLGTGAPPAVQGLLEHNVRLQVEVEELRRQLTDKQELLAAAAEAIDVLENQGSISTEAADVSIANSVSSKKGEEVAKVAVKNELGDETCPSESAGEYLAATINNDDVDQLAKLRKQYRNALQMIKSFTKKIEQQDKQIKKLKLDKELSYAQVSDTQLEKYEEMLKCKDEHIKDLENKVRQLQNSVDGNVVNDSAGNLHHLLTRRLQGVTYFLDKLLSHKCVLGEDKKKLAESILEQSLALPVGLQLDESMAIDELSVDESNFDVSQSMRMEDLTMMFGHHLNCSDDVRHSTKKASRYYPQADAISESECWSEPDRNVSLARVGLSHIGFERDSISDVNRYRFRRSRVSNGSRSEDSKMYSESALTHQINELTLLNNKLEEEKAETLNKLELAMNEISDLKADKEDLREALATERSKVYDANKKMETMQNNLLHLESLIKDNEQQIAYNAELVEKMRVEKQDLEETFLETERALRRAADEATVQASQAALERARAQHDRLQIERELELTREKLSAALDANAQLEIEATKKFGYDAEHKIPEIYNGLQLEEVRPTSPDQGIDSDRLSSLEQNDVINLSPRSLYEENINLKQKLARTKATLADTLTQLNAANMKKRSVERAVCREIHKTHSVLRKARDQLEHHN